MTSTVKEHLPVIVVVAIVGIATTWLALSQVLAAVPTLDADTFATLTFLVPCAVMFVGSTAITLTAHKINRQMYLVVVGICLVAGLVCMVLASVWQSNAEIAAQLIANSAEGTTLTPVTDSPILVLRDITAFFVAGTVGCILGAWLGSRIHPMTATK